MKYYLAPVQGHTDAAYRHFHAAVYGNQEVEYTTPFIRLEKGELRKKDFKDASSGLNEPQGVVAQVIFKNTTELKILTEILKGEGFRKIDINMGCPFPLQTARGRGAASVTSEECRQAVAEVVTENPDISFSVKMRLGMNEEEWHPLLDTLNTLELDHITVHPRIAREQYTPDTLHMGAFREIYGGSRNPVVYNGEIHTPEEAAEIAKQFPGLQGIMIGRGALGRPSIFTEIISGEEWDEEKRIRTMLEFHRRIYAYYKENLIGGEHQVLQKIQPFWEYAEAEIGRKAWKAIRKASTISKYQSALAGIFH